MGKAAKTSAASAPAAAAVDQEIMPADSAATAEPVAAQAPELDSGAVATEPTASEAPVPADNAVAADAVGEQAAAIEEAAAVVEQADAGPSADFVANAVEAELRDTGVDEAIDPPAGAAPRTVRARVLAFCALGVPDDVIEIDADQVETLGDVIDTHPAAVAYAESLKA